MNLIQSGCIMALVASLAAGASGATLSDSSIYGIFTGTTPCGPMIRPLHNVSPQADCALLEWKLILYQDPVTKEPTTYRLTSVNKYIIKATNQHSEPGIKTEAVGKWSIVKGIPSRPASVVYSLDQPRAGHPIHFVKLSEHLIHLLDDDGRLAVGNPFWNYTLSRTTN